MRRRGLLELSTRTPRGQLLRSLKPLDPRHVVPKGRVDGLLLGRDAHEPHGLGQGLVVEINLRDGHRTPSTSTMYVPRIHHQHWAQLGRSAARTLRLSPRPGRGPDYEQGTRTSWQRIALPTP